MVELILSVHPAALVLLLLLLWHLSYVLLDPLLIGSLSIQELNTSRLIAILLLELDVLVYDLLRISLDLESNVPIVE